MQIKVSGKSLDIGTAIQDYVRENLNRIVTKYFDRAINGDVIFSKQGAFFRADIHVNEGTRAGIVIKGEGEANEAHAAFDAAAERIEKQLRRYKRRITNHHKEKHNSVFDARQYVIASDEESEASEDETPVIVAEKEEHVETLSVGEAVMKMDLASLPALLFINRMSGRINMVYKRTDGNISWVDPQLEKVAIAS